MHHHVSGTECLGFLKARCLWEPGSQNSNICVRTWNPVHGNSQIRQNLNLHARTWYPVQPLNFPFSAFCGRRLLWMSVGRNYHSYRWPYDCTFFFQVVIIFVLVLVQIDLIHFEHTKCIKSTSNKTRDDGSYTSRRAPSICPRSHGFFFCEARHLLAVDISCTSRL